MSLRYDYTFFYWDSVLLNVKKGYLCCVFKG